MNRRPASSSGLADARRSFNALRARAHALASLSASFTEEAREATAAYRDALANPSTASWARFVAACATLAKHGAAVESLLDLNDDDRASWRFFQQIADENADLLGASAERDLVLA
jgi:hypothetical protein